MKQRLGIAGALLRDPRLLLLDEPTTGLDPAGMRDMRALVHRLAEDGLTVLLSSHLMGEVEDLCDRVAIVTRGRVVYEGALDELIAVDRPAATTCARPTTGPAAVIARRAHGIYDVTTSSRGLSFAADERAVAALTLELAQAGIGLRALVPRTATLEELFFRMTEGVAGAPTPMLVIDMSAVAVRVPRGPASRTVYAWELRKLAAQKRTYIGLGCALLVPLIFITALLADDEGPGGDPVRRPRARDRAWRSRSSACTSARSGSSR